MERQSGSWKKATPGQYEDAIVVDPSIVEVRDKVKAMADDQCRAGETHIVVTTKDGRRWEKHVDHAVGSLQNPLTDDMLDLKFMYQVEKVLGGDQALVAREKLMDIEMEHDIAELAQSFVDKRVRNRREDGLTASVRRMITRRDNSRTLIAKNRQEGNGYDARVL